MSVPLLATKLFVPPVRRRLVPRPRLIDRLNQGLEYPLILLSAPAGYGKTTLLSSWLDQCTCASAWLSLDEGDNDLARFLTYLIADLQKIQPEIGGTVLTMLQSLQVLQANSLLSTLINEIALFPDHFVLILDDYHAILDPSVHQAVDFLIAHLPAQMHLVISTRADPPLPLARLRGRAQLLELRAAELCFTVPEAGMFLSQAMGISLPDPDVEVLTTRTEGWITGLQMAAVTVQGRPDAGHFIHTFAGSNRHILDYLLEEVLERQPEMVQAFLLQTSILSQLSGPLCDAVTGGSGSQAILEGLDRANLFIVSLDDQRCWYRYHHLLSDLLRQSLQNTGPELTAALHLRASEWYEQNGYPAEAIGHAFSAGEFQRAARLVEKTADTTLMHGELKTFLGWVERLPAEVARQQPLLCVYHAEALLLSGRPMDQATGRLAGAPEYAAIQALIAAYQGDAALSKQLSQQALELLPAESVYLRGVITSALGAVQLLSGEVEPTIQTFQAAAEIGRASENLILQVIALCRVGQLHHLKGELHQAEAFLRKALELSTDRQGAYLPVASMPLMLLAYLLREWNDLGPAFQSIQEAVHLCQLSGGFWSVDCYIVCAFVLQAQGDTGGARDAICTARKIAAQTEANRFDEVYTAAYEARLCLAQGDLDAAVRWVNQAGSESETAPGTAWSNHPNTPFYHLVEVQQSTLARVYLAQGRVEAALPILCALLDEAEKRGRWMSVVENLVLQALALHSQGKLTEALDTLETALDRGETEGFVRIFVDEGLPMQKLLRAAVQQTHLHVAYMTRLLAASETAPPAAAAPAPVELMEGLSARELEVLRLIAAGSTNREIAGRLVISLSTVKGHTANIFGKLAVKNRTQAVARGRELGLID